tara:strand:- start:51 stop:1208 length:1158 start_codon:yes stop_codon:yes gene_type:complete
MKVGIIGCGNIADIYLHNANIFFNNFEIIACADLNSDASKYYSKKYKISNLSVEQLLSNEEIDLIINLTIPNAHYEVSKSILNSGKHSYSEKPISIEFDQGKELLNLAKSKNLYVGSAPDTFLGAGIQKSKQIIQDGTIGDILLGSISMGVAGHEIWHPNPDFYYKYGGGPILDMGPYYFSALVNLLGPVKSVYSQSRTVFSQREIGSGIRKGEKIDVDIPTTLISQIEFSNGALIDSFFSFDVYKHNKPHIELFGTKGAINVPDPNMFGGEIKICDEKKSDWKTIKTDDMNLGRLNTNRTGGEKNDKANEDPTSANFRGIGVCEMIDSIKENKKNRCSGELSLHVLEIMQSILKSAEIDKKVNLESVTNIPDSFLDTENGKFLK